MNKFTIVIFFIFFSLQYACKEVQHQSDTESIYDIEILYTYPERDNIIPNQHFNEKYLNNGKLYLHFETHFDNDSVLIEKNGKVLHEKNITTDASTGVAWTVEIDNIKEVKNISVSVNNGRKAFFEISKSNHISIDYRDTLLSVKFLSNVPYYD